MPNLLAYVRQHDITAWIDAYGRLLAIDMWSYSDTAGACRSGSQIVELPDSLAAIRTWLGCRNLDDEKRSSIFTTLELWLPFREF